jgi:hypothetical protein
MHLRLTSTLHSRIRRPGLAVFLQTRLLLLELPQRAGDGLVLASKCFKGLPLIYGQDTRSCFPTSNC